MREVGTITLGGARWACRGGSEGSVPAEGLEQRLQLLVQPLTERLGEALSAECGDLRDLFNRATRIRITESSWLVEFPTGRFEGRWAEMGRAVEGIDEALAPAQRTFASSELQAFLERYGLRAPIVSAYRAGQVAGAVLASLHEALPAARPEPAGASGAAAAGVAGAEPAPAAGDAPGGAAAAPSAPAHSPALGPFGRTAAAGAALAIGAQILAQPGRPPKIIHPQNSSRRRSARLAAPLEQRPGQSHQLSRSVDAWQDQTLSLRDPALGAVRERGVFTCPWSAQTALTHPSSLERTGQQWRFGPLAAHPEVRQRLQDHLQRVMELRGCRLPTRLQRKELALRNALTRHNFWALQDPTGQTPVFWIRPEALTPAQLRALEQQLAAHQGADRAPAAPFNRQIHQLANQTGATPIAEQPRIQEVPSQEWRTVTGRHRRQATSRRVPSVHASSLARQGATTNRFTGLQQMEAERQALEQMQAALSPPARSSRQQQAAPPANLAKSARHRSRHHAPRLAVPAEGMQQGGLQRQPIWAPPPSALSSHSSLALPSPSAGAGRMAASALALPLGGPVALAASALVLTILGGVLAWRWWNGGSQSAQRAGRDLRAAAPLREPIPRLQRRRRGR
jgi:hypothetical protein